MATTAVAPRTQGPAVSGSPAYASSTAVSLPGSGPAEFAADRSYVTGEGLRELDAAKEAFRSRYLADARSFVEEKEMSVARLSARQEDLAFSIFSPSTYFGGGARNENHYRLENERKVLEQSQQTVRSLEERIRYADSVAASAQQVIARAEALQQSGQGVEALELASLARNMMELSSTMLPMSDTAYAQAQKQFAETLKVVGRGNAVPAAELKSELKRGLFFTSGVVARWQSEPDTETGRIRAVSTRPQTTEYAESVRRAEEAALAQQNQLQQGQAQQQGWSWWKIGVGLAVATTAFLLSGPIAIAALPAFLGGAAMSGILGGCLGALVGVAAGTALGAACAFGEQLSNQLVAGKADWRQAWAETKGYAGTAFGSVAAGKLFAALGSVAGAAEGFLSRFAYRAATQQSFPWIGKMVKWYVIPLVKVSSTISVPAVAGGTTYLVGTQNGRVHQISVRKEFQDVVRQYHPELNLPENAKQYFEAEKEYLHAMGVSDGDVRRMAATDALVAGISGLLHVKFPTGTVLGGSTKEVLRRSAVGAVGETWKHGVSIGSGAVAELAIEKADTLDGRSDFSSPFDSHMFLRLFLSSFVGREAGRGYRQPFRAAVGAGMKPDGWQTAGLVGGTVVPAAGLKGLQHLAFPSSSEEENGN